MLIAIVEFEVNPSRRRALLEQIEEEARNVRGMEGNMAYQALVSAASESGIVLVQEWRDEPAFAEYRASDSFSALNQYLKPEMTGPPSSRAFNALPV
ncbi:antibiotic biosynthesis monooxygenase [Hoeflea sp. WL0058]|uniref:Antibiotic biosynthesis monooxygenase n=1 Tax=Flavimaribacter sediminis TaxID=2865987 RepID=A0AAE2ZU10_9HYPH|nr:antibiotic biosynthesis monooxygenase [Flavimaribacter sediminis]MBW8640438.1 antibiotic biosynthesis monooxygenase [Flavimaribacter sediminis]